MNSHLEEEVESLTEDKKSGKTKVQNKYLTGEFLPNNKEEKKSKL